MPGDVAASRRRRRTGAPAAMPVSTHPVVEPEMPSLENRDYYDDDDEDLNSRDKRMYSGACSFGQFVLNPCLCLLKTAYGCWASTRRKSLTYATALPCVHYGDSKARRIAEKLLMTAAIVFSVVCLVTTYRKLRHFFLINDRVSEMPLEIAVFDFERWHVDIGGWQFFHRFILPTTKLETTERYPGYYGGLEFVGAFGQPRVQRPHDDLVAEVYLATIRDSQRKVPLEYEHTDAILDMEGECRRTNWMQDYKPLCNAMHELDLTFDFNEDHAGLGDIQVFDSFYISHGFWRDVWVVHQRDQDVKSILKKSRWEHKYNSEVFYMTLNDALIMERLTKSPRIVDIYGHCGYSVWVEALPYEMEQVIVPGSGFAKQEDLHDEDSLKPKNSYTDEEKLNISLSMAESLADLHGFEDGLIVHDDVQLCQWLEAENGQLKLGDFNRAEFPLFNTEKQQYCKWNNGRGYGNYRAPEEFAAQNLDQKIDVWSFGNNVYGLLTGLWVFYDTEDDAIVHERVKGGETAFVDDRYRTKSFITKSLVEVMEKCWALKPEDRIEIFDVVRLLREIQEEYNRMKASDEFKMKNEVSQAY